MIVYSGTVGTAAASEIAMWLVSTICLSVMLLHSLTTVRCMVRHVLQFVLCTLCNLSIGYRGDSTTSSYGQHTK